MFCRFRLPDDPISNKERIMFTKMSYSFVIVLIMAVTTGLWNTSTVSAQQYPGPIPANKNFSGKVTLTRAGIDYQYNWDMRFGPASRVNPTFSIGGFSAVISGVPQTGWYTFNHDTWETFVSFSNPFQSRAWFKPTGSAYIREGLLMTRFWDNQGNSYKRDGILLNYK
jgi:hypothetical protein